MKSYSSTAKSVHEAGTKISSFGQWLMANNGEGGATLVSIGTAIAAQQYWIAAAIVGTQLLRTFLAMQKDSGSTSYAHNEQTVRLSGDMTQLGVGSNASLLLSNICGANPSDVPYIWKAHPTLQLGLFRLKRRPLLSLVLKNSPHSQSGHLYQIEYQVDNALRDIVEVNPSIPGLSLDQLTYQVVYPKRVRASNQYAPIDNPNLVQLGSDMTTEPDPANPDFVNIFNREMVDPAGGATFGTIIKWGRYCSGAFVPEYVGADTKLLRLRMTFNINGEQVADFLGSYEPELFFASVTDTAFY